MSGHLFEVGKFMRYTTSLSLLHTVFYAIVGKHYVFNFSVVCALHHLASSLSPGTAR